MKKSTTGSLALTAALVLTLSACGAPAQPISSSGSSAAPAASASSATGSSAPAADPNVKLEGVTLTYFVDALGDSIISSYNDNVMYKEVMKELNLTIDFQHSAKGEFGNQLGVILASSDLPDMIEGFRYAKGPAAAVSDGLILPLNELAATYAPDFTALIEGNPEIKRQVMTDEGELWAISCLQPKAEPAWRGFSIRKDMLAKAGLETPTTLSELESTMVKFKEMGVSTPLSMKIEYTHNANTPFYTDNALIAAYGIGADWYKDLKTGKVEFGPMQDAYKDFLTMMNRWYAQGLLDADFNVRKSNETDPFMVNGQMGVVYAGYGPTSNFLRNGQATNAEYELVQFPNLPLNKGEVVQSRNWDPMNKGNDTVITTSCEYPEAAMKFLNFGFSEKGSLMYNYGLEGVSYTMVDGKPQFTPQMTDGSEGSWPNIREKYKKHTGPYKRDWAAAPLTDFELNAMEVWNQPGTELRLPQKMTRTAEEDATFTPLMTDMYVFLSENVTNFITGKRSLSEFDKFREELKGFRVEEAQKIQQSAYDRYLSR